LLLLLELFELFEVSWFSNECIKIWASYSLQTICCLHLSHDIVSLLSLILSSDFDWIDNEIINA